jgi:hypothetical protein
MIIMVFIIESTLQGDGYRDPPPRTSSSTRAGARGLRMIAIGNGTRFVGIMA